MTENCLPSQMTGFITYFSLLKVKVDIPFQKVIVYVDHFSIYRKTVSLICSLCNGHSPIQAAIVNKTIVN